MPPLRIADLPRPARHSIGGRGPRDPHHLRRGSGQGIQRPGPSMLKATETLPQSETPSGKKEGHWKSGSVYLWIVAAGNITFFHATEPFREGRPTDLTRTDINGVMFAEELIGGARREGRKFLQYNYDDPTIEGDEDTGSPKLGYAVSIPVFDTGQKAVIGSGVYLGTGGAASDTDAITKAWLARFGRTVTDQVVDAVTGRLEAPRRGWGERDAGRAGPAVLDAGRLGRSGVRQVTTGSRTAHPSRRRGTRRRCAAGWPSPGRNRSTARRASSPGRSRSATSSQARPSALSAQAGGAGGGFASIWGRGRSRRLTGAKGDLALDGTVTTGLIGADWASAPGVGTLDGGAGHRAFHRVGRLQRGQLHERQLRRRGGGNADRSLPLCGGEPERAALGVGRGGARHGRGDDAARRKRGAECRPHDEHGRGRDAQRVVAAGEWRRARARGQGRRALQPYLLGGGADGGWQSRGGRGQRQPGARRDRGLAAVCRFRIAVRRRRGWCERHPVLRDRAAP